MVADVSTRVVSAGEADEGGGRVLIVGQEVGRQSKGQVGVCYLGLEGELARWRTRGRQRRTWWAWRESAGGQLRSFTGEKKNQVKVRPRSSAIAWYNACVGGEVGFRGFPAWQRRGLVQGAALRGVLESFLGSWRSIL